MVKYFNFCCFTLLITTVNIFSQVSTEWVQRYNGNANRFDVVTTMKLAPDGNPVVFGNGNFTGNFTDITVIKYSSSGNILWQTQFNGYSSQLDECKDALIDNSGSSYITGFTSDTNQVLKIVTLKISPGGNIEWSAIFLPPAYNQGMGLSIAKDNTGNIYTCGSLRRANGTNTIVVVKYSNSGQKLAESYYNKTANSSETPVSICIDNSGMVYIFAGSDAVNSQVDLLVLKYSPALTLLKERSISGNQQGNDVPVKMILASDNKPVLIAAVNNQPGGLDYGIYKLDTSLISAFQIIYNGTGNNQDLPYSITADTFNNIYVTGSSRNADTLGSEDFYTMKIGPAGQVIWGKRFDASGRGHDYGTAISVDKYGNVFAGGTTDKHEFHQQYGLLKYRANGDLEWLTEYSRIVNSEDFIYSVIADNNSNIYVTGISFDSLSDYDIATIKFSEPIGITNISNQIPEKFKLYQNYPNPFNPSTKIRFDIPVNFKNTKYRIDIFDITGRLVKNLFAQNFAPGSYEIEFSSENLANGVYFYRISNEILNYTQKMIILK